MVSGSRILLADDDPQLLETVADGLTQLGAEVIRADSGAELIEQLANEGPFDLIITDVAMPWMSGLEAIHSARSVGLRTPVIIMTALPGERIAAQTGMLGGHAALLRKPFTLSELESVVTTSLSGAR